MVRVQSNRVSSPCWLTVHRAGPSSGIGGALTASKTSHTPPYALGHPHTTHTDFHDIMSYGTLQGRQMGRLMDLLHASYQPAPTAPTSGGCSCRRPHGDAVNALVVALSHQRVAMLVAVRSAACKAFKLKQLQLCAASVRSTPQIAAAAYGIP